jgi:hypothetical protein
MTGRLHGISLSCNGSEPRVHGNEGGDNMGMKEAYQEKMDARLREWQAKIDELKARADQAGAEQKMAYYEQIESLRARQQKAQAQLNELRSAGEDAWEDVKAGVELAWQDLQEAFGRASEKFK